MSKVSVGRTVKGKVTGITDYGAFVGIGDKYIGLIHISEISPYFVKNIEDYLKVGDEVRCKVLEIMEDGKHLKLTIKGVNYKFGAKSGSRILETKKGFNTLKGMLPKWIKKSFKKQ